MPFEVQIRTEEMHRECEYGVAAHWRYKEGLFVQEDFDDKLSWIRQVLEWQEDLETAAPLVDILKGDVFSDQVFVFSPKGDVVDLPAGATPLDFAYRIHTEVGHHCIGAKVNGRLVSLEYELQNGDRVEILTSKGSRDPVATGSRSFGPVTPATRSGSGSSVRSAPKTRTTAGSFSITSFGVSAIAVWPGSIKRRSNE